MLKINPNQKQLSKYFKNNQVKIVPKQWEEFVKLTTIRSGGKMVQFTPYPYQILLSDLMDKYSNIVVIKSRQLGITQCIASKFLHRACLSTAYSSIAFLRNQDDASALSRRTRQMLEGLKEYITKDSDNVGYLKLKGKGEIYFKNSSKEGSRSYDSVLDFLFDEAAFCENIEQIYAASSPSGALAGDNITKLIISTPSAKSGWYWHKLNDNNNGENIEELCKAVARGELYKDIPGCYWFVDSTKTVKLILHWTAHPIYRQNNNYLEYRKIQDGTDEETILREYDLKFVDASVSVFSADLIRSCAVSNWEEAIDQKAKYYAGLDCSTIGNDYLCFSIIKEVDKKYKLIQLYRMRKQSSEYHLFHIGELIKKYKIKNIGIETTGGVGQIYLEQLYKVFPYLNMIGITTTMQTKAEMINRIIMTMEKQIFEFPNTPIITEEFLNFVRKGNKLEAATGKHDDIVMSIAFALSISSVAEIERIEMPLSNETLRMLEQINIIR